MFTSFLLELKQAGLPVTLKEYLVLMEALEAGLIERDVEEFYYLARAALIKDERHLDRFDQVFARVFKGLETLKDSLEIEIPEDWLRALTSKFLSEEEKARIEALGGWDKIMEELKNRLAEQEKRHEGGSKWIGTRGTSPFGAHGYNPAGIRIGQEKGRHGRAIKVWDKRDYKNLDDTLELGTRNIKMALRRLRQFARQGAAEELDLNSTINATASKGYLDIKLVPEQRNNVKVLLFFDVGGSMDPHIHLCEQLFSAARAEFKHMEYFYFHNCPYEFVWKNNRRRRTERIDTWEVLHTYPADYKVIFVGDASMSPYELTYPGGSVEHVNAEPGLTWLERVLDIHEHAVWLNPTAEQHWRYTPSIDLVGDIFSGRMYPLTLEGLDNATRELMR